MKRNNGTIRRADSTINSSTSGSGQEMLAKDCTGYGQADTWDWVRLLLHIKGEPACHIFKLSLWLKTVPAEQ